MLLRRYNKYTRFNFGGDNSKRNFDSCLLLLLRTIISYSLAFHIVTTCVYFFITRHWIAYQFPQVVQSILQALSLKLFSTLSTQTVINRVGNYLPNQRSKKLSQFRHVKRRFTLNFVGLTPASLSTTHPNETATTNPPLHQIINRNVFLIWWARVSRDISREYSVLSCNQRETHSVSVIMPRHLSRRRGYHWIFFKCLRASPVRRRVLSMGLKKILFIPESFVDILRHLHTRVLHLAYLRNK